MTTFTEHLRTDDCDVNVLYELKLGNGRSIMGLRIVPDSPSLTAYQLFGKEVRSGIGIRGPLPQVVLHPPNETKKIDTIADVSWFAALTARTALHVLFMQGSPTSELVVVINEGVAERNVAILGMDVEGTMEDRIAEGLRQVTAAAVQKGFVPTHVGAIRVKQVSAEEWSGLFIGMQYPFSSMLARLTAPAEAPSTGVQKQFFDFTVVQSLNQEYPTASRRFVVATLRMPF